MDKSQKKKMVAVIITLVISVISLGVAFAAFSTTLNINGTANVDESWNVKIIINKSYFIFCNMSEVFLCIFITVFK